MFDILTILVEERDKIDRAIAALQENKKRRGRPPGKLSKKTTPAKLRKRAMSAAARKRVSARMRAYWAARKKAAKKAA